MRAAHRLGETFAGYEIEEVLGRGGMSEVLRARNPKLGNVVALKLLAPDLAEDEVFRERFVRESRIAASLDHPNVLPIHDAGEADGVPYIAMRFVDGPDLGELLRKGELPAQHAVSIVGQVAGALDAAHERGLIHRDVKPANILIDRYSGLDAAPHVYLADFGVAKHTLSRSGLTTTGEFVGTIDYVAPEQIEGKQVDSRTDVYALGCVFYECLTSKKPFDRDSNVAVMYAHLLEPPPAPSEAREGLPAGVDAVVAKALAKSPDERYATCGELAAAARVGTGRRGGDLSRVCGRSWIPRDRLRDRRRRPPATAAARANPRHRKGRRRQAPEAARQALPAGRSRSTRARRNQRRRCHVTRGVQQRRGKGAGHSATTPTTRTKPKPPPAVRVKVPLLLGATQTRAVRLLKARGFRVRIRHVHSSTKKGRVTRQVPRQGLRKKHALVLLTVSTGRAPSRKVSPPPPAVVNPPPPVGGNPPPPYAPPPPPPPIGGGCHGC